MSHPAYERIRSNPKFQQLVAHRSRFAWALALVVLVLYYGFMAIVAFRPGFLAQSLSGGVTTIGWPLAATLMALFWALTGFYVWRANTRFDALNAELLAEATKGGQR